MKHLLYILMMMNSLQSLAQQQQVIHLWPGAVPGETAAKHAAKPTPDTGRGVIRLTDVTDPILTVYPPADSTASRQTGIIVCPGGGYSILAINLEGEEIARWLSGLGYTAFVLQYRVPQKEAGALQDVQRAIRMVKSRAKTWNIHPDRVGVLGFSAGGSLSARASTLYTQDTYPKVDKADELSCKPAFAVLIYPAYLDKGTNRGLTPELTVNKDTPPMFLFATADDHYGNSALVMAGALRDAKVPVELHFYPNGGHGYGLRPGNPAADVWPGLAEKWLDNITK
ncbi:alpha/beta hydrolase [Chitinophaga agrisoli]|uniref:Alpha/beta hydrolase n=1 Tax=Chitinophaga agrisoli TaxID=2607653 RepID=A0A5B2VJF6_9BACT|nr:alpha/beta hydrolase [Chitinophaga agrisoli]KAA2238666.1 alpha/beta hydrolase [Chitinophaga agrisoli]